MACRMMVDVSRFQLAEDAKNGVATMSLCCCYNFEAAIEFLHEYDKEVGGEDVKQDINYLLASKRRLHRRWMFPEIST